MTPDEVVKVLARIQADDNRDIGQITVASWQQGIGDLDFREALDAVALHRRESKDWLMPAHVRANVRLLRARRKAAEDRARSIERQRMLNGSTQAADDVFDRAAFDALTEQWVEYYRQHPEER